MARRRGGSAWWPVPGAKDCYECVTGAAHLARLILGNAQLLTTISKPVRGVSVTEPSLDDLYQAVASAA